jgi:hypothetical protein
MPNSEDARTPAYRIIAASVAAGIAFDLLLRAGPWGVNFPLWMLLVLTLAGVLAWRLGVERRPCVLATGTFALAAAAGLALRDSPALKLLDLAAAGTLLAWGLWQARAVRLRVGGVVEHAWRLLFAGFAAFAGLVVLLVETASRSRAAGGSGPGRAGRAAAIGVVIAAPLLFVFGGLFASADAVFARGLAKLVAIDFAEVMSHIVPIGLGTWFAGGWLVAFLLHDRVRARGLTVSQFVALGAAEVNVALGLVNLLFLTFIAVQVQYLFGGSELVEVTPGLSYSEYARSGFFQLVAAVALAVPTLLGADWVLAKSGRKAFRVQAALLVLMLDVVLASAWHRLGLYQSEYGWTALRLYVAVFMGWLAVTLLWFCATVLTGRRDRFVFGAVTAGFATVALLNAWNPEAWIVRQNLELARRGRDFDAKYAARLSADAIPALAKAWPELGRDQQKTLAKAFERFSDSRPRDWRTWSVSVAEARRVLADNGPRWRTALDR